MTLLMALFAAVVSTAVWYVSAEARTLKVGLLCYMFWGASLMWLVDAVASYLEVGTEIFEPSADVLLNDAFLGLSVVALALVIWIACLLIKDPKGIVKEALGHK